MDNNVVSLGTYKRKKLVQEDVARGRTPLYISYLDGHIKGGAGFQRHDEDTFAERWARIQAALDKINKMSAEVKNAPVEEG